MKERGIIFNAEMVRAVLDGRKTQTRRIVKNVIPGNCLWLKKPTKTRSGTTTHVLDAPKYNLCPLGEIGDRLWVRETYSLLGNEDACPIDWDDNIVNDKTEAARIYRASCARKPGDYGLWSIPDDADWKPHTEEMKFEGSWTPSIHMPRWASRITLEITDVRAERLQSISEVDAEAEGVIAKEGISLRHIFSLELWESIYGSNSPESWSTNPWVWVIEFKRV